MAEARVGMSDPASVTRLGTKTSTRDQLEVRNR
jgi:hypothetical protein